MKQPPTSWKEIPGWSCPRVIDLYDEMARQLTPGAVAVECGVAYGKSLAYLATVLDPGVDILAVDIWQTFQGRKTYPEAYRFARERWAYPLFAARGYVEHALAADIATNYREHYNRIEWVQARAEDVPMYLDFEVDFVFLDDHHEEESVYREILAWLPRLKSGGVIAGHDVNDHYPGVERAVRRALGTGRNQAQIIAPAPGENGWGGCWVWRKP